MWEDSIVEETRALRQEMMDEAGKDLDDLFEYLQREQAQYKERLVRLAPRKAIMVAVSAEKR